MKRAEEVDKNRQTLVVLALKIRVKKGEAEKGIEQLELLKKFGGSIESNILTLEQITAEMASQIQQLRREGKAAEAKSLPTASANSSTSSPPNRTCPRRSNVSLASH